MDIKNKLIVREDLNLKEAIERLDIGGKGILFFIDDSNKLFGILTDGDLRRALLKTGNFESKVNEHINRDFFFGTTEQTRDAHIGLLRKKNRRHLPVINNKKELVDIVLLESISETTRDTYVVLIVGGKGTRLGSLTESTPKPMLPVGGKPILERIVENFVNQSFENFIFCINHYGDQIRKHFGDGSKWGINITYTEEPEPLGTAGPLALIDKIKSPFIVMNGDLLTNINFAHMLEFHKDSESFFTVGTRHYEVQIPFGVVESDELTGEIKKIVEKPTLYRHTNAGIYVLDPKCLDLIPSKTSYDMPELIDQCIKKSQKVSAFPIHEEWVDIGRPDDYYKCFKDYED